MKQKNKFNENEGRDEFRANHKAFCAEYQTTAAPIGILYDPKLSSNAKVLFLIIQGLSFTRGYCWATNPGLAERMRMDKSSIKKYLTELKSEGLIYTESFTRNHMFRRKIFIEMDEMRSRYKTIEQERAEGGQTPFEED